MYWMQAEFMLNESDKVLQKTPISFDASVWEFYAPLMAGAQLVMAAPGGHYDPKYIIKTIREKHITTLQLVPSLLKMLIQTEGIEKCTSLKRLCCGGEALPMKYLEIFFKNPSMGLYNLYGPTEAAIDTIFWKCKPTNKHIAPIGRSVANTQTYILDDEFEPVPIGVTGELYIGGESVGRGYLNRPELTREKFMLNIFNPDYMLYKTGDLARYLWDGTIEFLGRIDHQVKIRGFRIELGEIEAALAKHPAVKQAVVIDKEYQAGDKRLLAYFVPNPDLSVLTGELKEFLRESLPDYMIPYLFVALENIPLTPNGKTDRNALPAPDQRQTDEEYIAPTTQIEHEIARIWQDVLKLEKAGIRDNFFDLGGHSLLLIQVQTRLQEVFDREIPVVELFKYPTIAALAEYLSERGKDHEEEASTIQQIQDRANRQKEAMKRRRRA
jgi:acyl-coenzyme A synthetase/AMP-(fatty) acid ligase/acyl carrier protein